MNKSLKSKAIKIHNKDYVKVKDRIIYFNDTYENGCIKTKILSDGDRVVVKAFVYPVADDKNRYFTGISASNPSKEIEKHSPHEVAETSAVGRALAMMGIGVIDSVASVDEVRKATSDVPTKYVGETASSEVKMVTEKQVKFINTLISNLNKDRDAVKDFYKVKSMNDLTRPQASELIENLNNQATTIH